MFSLVRILVILLLVIGQASAKKNPRETGNLDMMRAWYSALNEIILSNQYIELYQKYFSLPFGNASSVPPNPLAFRLNCLISHQTYPAQRYIVEDGTLDTILKTNKASFLHKSDLGRYSLFEVDLSTLILRNIMEHYGKNGKDLKVSPSPIAHVDKFRQKLKNRDVDFGIGAQNFDKDDNIVDDELRAACGIVDSPWVMLWYRKAEDTCQETARPASVMYLSDLCPQQLSTTEVRNSEAELLAAFTPTSGKAFISIEVIARGMDLASRELLCVGPFDAPVQVTVPLFHASHHKDGKFRMVHQAMDASLQMSTLKAKISRFAVDFPDLDNSQADAGMEEILSRGEIRVVMPAYTDGWLNAGKEREGKTFLQMSTITFGSYYGFNLVPRVAQNPPKTPQDVALYLSESPDQHMGFGSVIGTEKTSELALVGTPYDTDCIVVIKRSVDEECDAISIATLFEGVIVTLPDSTESVYLEAMSEKKPLRWSEIAKGLAEGKEMGYVALFKTSALQMTEDVKAINSEAFICMPTIRNDLAYNTLPAECLTPNIDFVPVYPSIKQELNTGRTDPLARGLAIASIVCACLGLAAFFSVLGHRLWTMYQGGCKKQD